MTLYFIPVRTGSDQETLAQLAGEIWREYWPSRIGCAQTEYMVEQSQSLAAIERDMAEHDYEYWFLVESDGVASDASGGAGDAGDASDAGDAKGAPWGNIMGFTGGHDEPATDRFFISKIYLLDSARGKGYCRRVVEFYTALCQTRGLRAMYLTVNKYNELGIRAYKGTGFEVIDSVETDIGSGFIMDDFIMEKQA